MGIARLQSSFARVFRQRCFYLFVSLIALIAATPFALESIEGRLAISGMQVLVIIAAVAAVGRTTMPFVIALLLGIPALGFQLMALGGLDDPNHASLIATGFYLAFYVAAIVYLLRYVFSEDVMTDDKLFGAASAYMMIGLAWTFAYGLAQILDPGAFGARRSFQDLLFMSFGLLTSNGGGEIVVVGAKARSLVTLEQVTGTLFIAILVARLAGIYPPKTGGAAGTP